MMKYFPYILAIWMVGFHAAIILLAAISFDGVDGILMVLDFNGWDWLASAIYILAMILSVYFSAFISIAIDLKHYYQRRVNNDSGRRS